MATISGSAPIPRSARAVSITHSSELTALRMPATAHMLPNRMVDFTVPHLSTIMPPASNITTAAIEYTE